MKRHISVVLLACCILGFAHVVHGQKFESYRLLGDTIWTSTNLGYERPLQIHVPLEFQKENKQRKYPVILIFDQQNKRAYQYLLSTIDYLTSVDQMPASIIVGVQSNELYRYYETQLIQADPSAKGEQNEQFIMHELLPWIQKSLQGSTFTLLMGHSRYGFFTTHLWQKYPAKIQACIASSPFFLQENVNLVDSMENAIKKSKSLANHRYYSFGIGNDYPDEYKKMTEKIASYKLNNLHIKGDLFQEADHHATPGLLANQSLYRIFEYWNTSQIKYFKNSSAQKEVLNSSMKEIEQHYGSAFSFSLGTMNGKGWDYYGKEQYQQAIDAWTMAIEYYPSFTEFYLFIAGAYKKLGKPYIEWINRFKKELPKSEFYSAEEKQQLLDELQQEGY